MIAKYLLEPSLWRATDDEILTFATAQWQLSDLREISNRKGCLPSNLVEQKSTTLTGKYILQVEKGYDISTPKYKQLEAMRKVANENIAVTDAEQTQAWEIKSKRMMQLFLTDGIQDVSAIEYQPIRFLKDIILPGLKIMIKGPVICRRGVILMDESNIMEIGGEVEHLLITNATENIFARTLNMPENPDPYNDTKQKTDEVAALFDDDFNDDLGEIIEMESENFSNRLPPANPQGSKSRKLNSSLNSTNTAKNVTRPVTRSEPSTLPVYFQAEPETGMEDIDFPDDDDIFDMIDENELESISKQSETGRQMKDDPNPVKSLNRGISEVTNIRANRNDDSIVLSEEEPEEMGSSPVEDPPKNAKKFKPSEQIDENLEDIGSLDWDDFELEVDTLKVIQTPAIPPKNPSPVKSSSVSAPFKTSETFSGVNKGMKPLQVTKTSAQSSSGRSGSPSTLKMKSTAQMKPLNSTPPGSKLLNNKKNTKPVENRRGIMDYFRKTEQPSPKTVERPKLCDFICEIKRLSLTQGSVCKKIWGRTKYLGKLGKGAMGWMLEGSLTDGTDSLDVEFSSSVLEKELGFTVTEFAVQKKQRKNNPEVEERLRQAFRAADARLKNMDALVEIELSLDNKKPKVISITDLSDAERKTITECKKRLGYS
ncbi:recQ-mediated genome instability protein 1-like isoform X2 [Diachasmimorpha longicaudata]|uniref:recQ-mediated genome instability protein 1-like isoform X2 n=1 Tax=Diachasmimorpha longicaudata TaxID=58733 RepID=UPI0030B91326